MAARTERFDTIPPVEAEFNTLHVSIGDRLCTDGVRFTTGMLPADVGGEILYRDPMGSETTTIRLHGPRLLRGHPNFVEPRLQDTQPPEHRELGVEMNVPNELQKEGVEQLAADLAAMLLRRAEV